MKKITFTLLCIGYCLKSFAQPDVRNEPRHHNVFENEYIRVLDVYIAPHDTTLFHLHNTPSVFTMFTKNRIVTQLKGQPAISGNSVAGYTWYDSLLTPRIHRVWNEDTSWFHVMDVELTSGKSQTNVRVIEDPSLKLLFNEKQVNGYHLQILKGSKLRLPASSGGYLLISLGDAEIICNQDGSAQHQLMKAGHYLWIGGDKISSLTAVMDAPAGFTLLQLK